MGRVECAILKAAELRAVKKGLLKPGKRLHCKYMIGCDGTTCFLEQDPQTRTIYLAQGAKTEIASQTEKFYARLRKWQELNSKRL